jgi:hypothetical protein
MRSSLSAHRLENAADSTRRPENRCRRNMRNGLDAGEVASVRKIGRVERVSPRGMHERRSRGLCLARDQTDRLSRRFETSGALAARGPRFLVVSRVAPRGTALRLHACGKQKGRKICTFQDLAGGDDSQPNISASLPLSASTKFSNPSDDAFLSPPRLTNGAADGSSLMGRLASRTRRVRAQQSHHRDDSRAGLGRPGRIRRRTYRTFQVK